MMIEELNKLLLNIDILPYKEDEFLSKSLDKDEEDFVIVGAGDPSAFKIYIRERENSYDKEKFKYFSNNGMAKINGKLCHNCCIFLSLTKILKHCDYNHFKKIRKTSKTDVESVYNFLKNKVPHLLDDINHEQSDIIIESFVKLTGIKIRLVYMIENESVTNWDLYDGNEEPDALIFQYPDHFECAINKKFIR